ARRPPRSLAPRHRDPRRPAPLRPSRPELPPRGGRPGLSLRPAAGGVCGRRALERNEMPGSEDDAGGRRDLALRALLQKIAAEGGRLLDGTDALSPGLQTRLAELRRAAREALRWLDASARPPEPAPAATTPARLLVVDDTEEIRKLLELRLGAR